MSGCPLTETCVFFNDEMAGKPELISTLFKVRFCQGGNEKCARWQVSRVLGPEFVPGGLYPNQTERARAIIEAGCDKT